MAEYESIKPESLFYTHHHLWINKGEQDWLTVGLTEHGQYLLGDIGHVILPVIGQYYAAGTVCVILDSVKTATEIEMPINGDIMEVNDALIANPHWVNEVPYNKGWLFKFKPLSRIDNRQWLSFTEYQRLLDE